MAKTKKLANGTEAAPVRSVKQEGDDIALASTMISLGARLQVLENETNLSYDRLSRLYREIQGCSAPKGMLPFSVDWYLSWRPNVHASIFYSIFSFLEAHAKVTGVAALCKAYVLYREHDEVKQQAEPLLSFTRAWMLLRFIKSDMLQMTSCTHCAIQFVTHAHEISANYVCPVCKPPARIVGILSREEEAATAKRTLFLQSLPTEQAGVYA